MKIFKAVCLVVLVLAVGLAFVSCSDTSSKGTTTKIEKKKDPGENKKPSDTTKNSLDSLKLIMLTGESDLLAEKLPPAPLNPQSILATFSKDIDCKTAESSIILKKAGAKSAIDMDIKCDPENTAKLIFKTNLEPKTEYTLKLSAWDADGKILAYPGMKDAVVFKTMIPGDITGDGLPEIAVGAPGDNGGVGVVYIYNSAKLTEGSDKALIGKLVPEPATPLWFGWSVDITSDINCDGFADIIVGAPGKLPDVKSSVFVYSGAEFAQKKQTLIGKKLSLDAPDKFGVAIDATDINLDSVPDIIVGAPRSNNKGAVVIYDGKKFIAGKEEKLATISPEELNDGARFGFSFTTADITGDKVPDLIVGAPELNTSTSIKAGALFLFNGKDFKKIRDRVAPPASGSWEFGSSVAFGDIDNDGVPDIVAGGPHTGGQGGAIAYSGKKLSDTTKSSTDAIISAMDSPEFLDSFGTSIAVGDLNADGYADIVIGAPNYTNEGNAHAGAVYFYNGAKLNVSDNFLRDPIKNPYPLLSFGASVALCSNITGDKFPEIPDVVIGAPGPGGGVTILDGATFKEEASGVSTTIQPTPSVDMFGLSISCAR